MSSLRQTLTSSIGAKHVMALTGLGLVGFVVAHMIGNLQVFAGRDTLNDYAEQMQSLGPVLWIMRLGLLAMFVVHVGSAFQLVRANKAARPEKYVAKRNLATTFAARTMWMSGLIVLAFVVYHIAHFTLGTVQPEFYGVDDGTGRPDVYHMFIMGFRSTPVAISYIVANIILALHISHGASSAFQTLGVRHPRLAPLKNVFGPMVGALIAAGNVAMPLAVMVGAIGGDVA